MTGPYAAAALEYARNGWPSVLPITGKFPPPKGYTGADGAWPSVADIMAWADGPEGALNIGLRMPAHVVGIDVDGYGDKEPAAYQTLRSAIERWGDLPPTWRSSARPGELAGIRFYSVPPGLAWPGQLGPCVDIIQLRHRYAVVAPSIHPSGSEYRWYAPGIGEPSSAVGQPLYPHADELPALPEAWVQGLTRGEAETATEKLDLPDAATAMWLDAAGAGEPCPVMQRALLRAQAEITVAGADRHGTAMRATARIAMLAAEGHKGARHAMHQFAMSFLRATAGEQRSPGEWNRLVSGAVGMAAARGVQTVDPCGLLGERHPSAGQVPAIQHPAAPLPPFVGERGPELRSYPDGVTVRSHEETKAIMPPFGGGNLFGGESIWTPTAPSAGEPSGEVQQPANGGTPSPGTTSPTLPTPASPTAATPDALPTRATAAPSAAAPDSASAGADPALALELMNQRARREAKRILDEQEAAGTWREPVWCRTLTEELALPDEPISFRIAEVLPVGANALFTAQFKAGKTTAINHLTKCLVDRQPFLGELEVFAPERRVAVFNYEVARDQYRRWLREVDIANTEDVTVLPLRGYSLPLLNARVTEWVVRWLSEHEIDVWVLDPYARASVGSITSENDNTEAGRLLDHLDVIKARAGVSELIVPVHTGREVQEEGQERARGATRLDDWADVRWFLTKDDEGQRFFRATGRDVEFAERGLTYDETSRGYVISGGSKAQVRGQRVENAIIATVLNKPGCSKSAIHTGVNATLRSADGKGAGQRTIDAAIDRLEHVGRLRIERSETGLAAACFLNETPRFGESR